MIRQAAVVLVLAGALAAVAAAPSKPASPPKAHVVVETVVCRVGAIVNDPDPHGLNVHATPRGKVIGQLPKGTEVHLDRSLGKWVRVDRAWLPDQPKGKKWPLGWVFAGLLTTHLKTPTADSYYRSRLSAAPRAGERSFAIPLDPAPKLHLESCDGSFLEVKLTWPHRKPMRGWLPASDHCPSTVTNCP